MAVKLVYTLRTCHLAGARVAGAEASALREGARAPPSTTSAGERRGHADRSHSYYPVRRYRYNNFILQ